MSTVAYKNSAETIFKYIREKGVPVGIKNIARNTNYSIRQVRAICLDGESKKKLCRVKPMDVGSNKYSPSLPIVVRRKDRSHGGMISNINHLTGKVRSKALSRFRRQQLHVFTMA